MLFCPDCGAPSPQPDDQKPADQIDELLPVIAKGHQHAESAAEPPAEEQPLEPVGFGAAPDNAPPSSSTWSPFAWLRSRRARILSRVWLALALVGTGVIMGWFIASDRSMFESEKQPTTSESPGASETTGPNVLTMPDVRGLEAVEARQVLADVGIAAAVVDVVDQPAAGEPGLILTQDPVYGYPVEDRVVLSVSTPAKVPQVRGRQATDVLGDLDQLGTEVRTATRYVPGVPVGQVASIDPAAGTALPMTVTVTVAAQPDELALTALDPVDYDCFTDSDSLNGASYDELLTCETDAEPAVHSWVIGRVAERVRGVVGISDSGDASQTMSLQILGDGVPLKTIRAEYGATVPFDLDVSGVLRLTFRARSTSFDYATLGIANLRLLGDQKRLEGLTQ